MNKDKLIDKVTIHVPTRNILGLMNPHDGSDPGTEPRELKLFPQTGRIYIGGLRTFFADDDTALELTILHPRTKRALLVGSSRAPIYQVPAVALNPDIRSSRYNQAEFYDGLYVPVVDMHEDSNIEPMYCSADSPLVVKVVGPHVLKLAVLGSDHYTVTRWNPESPFCPPEYLGEFRGPFPDSPPAPRQIQGS